MIDAHCPRCQEIETWEHIVKCKETMNLRKEFMEKLLLKLLKNKGKVNVNEIMLFCKDILLYLDSEDEDKYETNQYHVGMQELFRGYVVNDWTEVNFKTKKYRHLNAIIALECVSFYNRCWKHRIEILHDENKQKERMRTWYEREKEQGRNSNARQIRMYVEKYKFDTRTSSSDTYKRWSMNLKAIERKVEKIPMNDLRRYMIM